MATSIITRGSGVSIAGRQSRGLSPAFSRASTAYQSDGRLVGVGVPRFELVGGRRGVLIEEGTTNIVNLATWNPIRDSEYQTCTKTNDALFGQPIYKCVQKKKSTPPFQITAVDIPNGASYTISIWVKHEVPASGAHPFLLVDKVSVSRYGTKSGEWERVVVTYTNNTGATVYGVNVYFYTALEAGEVTYFACPQVDAKPYATSFIDGTRSLETLTVPISEVLDPSAGTIEGWVIINDKIANGLGWSAFFTHVNPTWPTNALYMARYNTPDQKINFRFNTLAWTSPSPIPLVVGERLHWVYRWDSEKITAYLNGQLLTERVNTAPNIQFADSLRVGSFYSGGEVPCAPMSGLRLHRRALTNEEIAAHAAGNIVASDCYHYPFDGDLWPAPGSLGAVVAPSIITRPGSLEVIGR